jgi:hypothetical protein
LHVQENWESLFIEAFISFSIQRQLSQAFLAAIHIHIALPLLLLVLLLLLLLLILLPLLLPKHRPPQELAAEGAGGIHTHRAEETGGLLAEAQQTVHVDIVWPLGAGGEGAAEAEGGLAVFPSQWLPKSRGGAKIDSIPAGEVVTREKKRTNRHCALVVSDIRLLIQVAEC